MQFFFKVIDVSIHQTDTIITSECLAHNKNSSLSEAVLFVPLLVKKYNYFRIGNFPNLDQIEETSEHLEESMDLWFLLSITFSSLIVWWCLTLN